jgi:hypothetical protein
MDTNNVSFAYGDVFVCPGGQSVQSGGVSPAQNPFPSDVPLHCRGLFPIQHAISLVKIAFSWRK